MDPKAFLDRWFGRPAPSPDLAPALLDLERLGVERPELAEAARALGALMIAAFDDSSLVLKMDEDAMRAGWSIGQPSFQAHPPRIDGAGLVARLRRVVDAVGPGVESARILARAIESRRFALAAWVAVVLAGRPDLLAWRAEVLGVDPLFAASTFRLTLLPSLAKVSAVLNLNRPEGSWDRGDCPHCGSRPLLAESRGLEQRIYYRCGLCAADWPGERLRCPSCGEVDSSRLHYSFVEGEQEKARLAHCDACLYDWKVVSTLTPLTPPAMIVADLATVHLDLLAADRRGRIA